MSGRPDGRPTASAPANSRSGSTARDPGPGDGAEAEELARLKVSEVMRAEQHTPLPRPIHNPPLLPLRELDPGVLERLAAEIVSRQNNQGAVSMINGATCGSRHLRLRPDPAHPHSRSWPL